MKRILTILAIAVAASASAQSTSFRYGNPPTGNNSALFLNWYKYTVADTGGSTVDTAEVKPRYANNDYNVTVTDSISMRLTTTGLYKGDVVTIYLTKGAGAGKLYLTGNWKVATGTTEIALTASKKSVFRFLFDGSYLIETARNANY